MTVEQIVRRQNAAPFVPYRLFLANGRELLIQHPDFLSVANKEELVTVFDLSVAAEILDLTLVVSLRYETATAKAQ
jgi:hypothetical protein